MEEIERFIPGMAGPIWYEHWHRYHFVAPLASGKVVVDAACGEGYGSALLARHAAKATGVDVSAAIVAQARLKYGAAANLEYVQGRCEQLPLAAGSIDLLVSFETLEHLPKPRALIAEAARVLRPEGVFVVSTPNKALYTDATGHKNPFHPSELNEADFLEALRKKFAFTMLLGQRVDAYSAIWPIARTPGQTQLLDARLDDAAAAAAGLPDPLYFIALCSASQQALEDAGARFSLFADREHGVYETLMREIIAARTRAMRAEAALAELQKRIAAP